MELGIVSEWQQLARMASKADMTPEEREAKEQEEFSTGPLRVLTDSVKNNTQVLINCRWTGAPHGMMFRTSLPSPDSQDGYRFFDWLVG